MARELSFSELEGFPSLDWSDISPRLTPALRASLEKVLASLNGAALTLDESYALANCEGDDLLGLLVAANTLRARANIAAPAPAAATERKRRRFNIAASRTCLEGQILSASKRSVNKR